MLFKIKHIIRVVIGVACCVAILFGALLLIIRFAINPVGSGMPSDRELMTVFHDHHATFEELRQIKVVSVKPIQAVSDSDGNSEGKKRREKELLSLIPNLLIVGADYDGTTRFIFARRSFLSVGAGWAKGIEYLPGNYERKGELEPNLDDGRRLQPGVYLREIEPHWFIFYQRDN